MLTWILSYELQIRSPARGSSLLSKKGNAAVKGVNLRSTNSTMAVRHLLQRSHNVDVLDTLFTVCTSQACKIRSSMNPEDLFMMVLTVELVGVTGVGRSFVPKTDVCTNMPRERTLFFSE